MFISPGNIKLGKIPNLSLPPILTCRKGAPCTKECYAMKTVRLYKSARQRWEENLKHYKTNSADFFLQIVEEILNKKYKFFRWHTGGDIPDDIYFIYMIVVAEMCSETSFLAFTKQYETVNRILKSKSIPSNLSVIFSHWGQKFPNPHKLPVAYLNAPKKGIIPPKKKYIKCPGSCEDCKVCFFANKFKTDVCFDIH